MVCAVAAVVSVVAPTSTALATASAHYAYTVVDPGTFGGPQSFLNLPAVPLTPQGTLLGTADTAIPDGDYPDFNPFMVGLPDPYLVHSFESRNGHMTDLGALPGNNSSAVFEVNGNGVGVGMSETATTDPYTGWPADHAVMFKNGQVIDLGTLPGGYESQANDINDRGQVSGFASNAIPDPYSLFGWGTQSRSFIWQNNRLQDIGTLGGPDAVSTTLNNSGQITGQSYANSTANPATGIPTLDPFLWQNGRMQDLGTLGGTVGFANWLNDAGQVVGTSDLAGDNATHPFLWNGTRLIDLGTLGGANGYANSLNDQATVVGKADLPDQTHHAFLWKQGHMRDLPPLTGLPCSNAGSVNNHDEAVGNSSDCHGVELAAMLWKDGSTYDLNTLVAPSNLHLTTAEYIDDDGEIAGIGRLPNGDEHVFLLIPNRSVSPSTATVGTGLPETAAAPSGVHGCRNLPPIVSRLRCRSEGRS
jgi:probable HAF family extracellular repeat protein